MLSAQIHPRTAAHGERRKRASSPSRSSSLCLPTCVCLHRLLRIFPMINWTSDNQLGRRRPASARPARDLSRCIAPAHCLHVAARDPRARAPAPRRRELSGATSHAWVPKAFRAGSRRRASLALVRRSRLARAWLERDPCPCSWTGSASGAGAAVRVGRLRPRGHVRAAVTPPLRLRDAAGRVL